MHRPFCRLRWPVLDASAHRRRQTKPRSPSAPRTRCSPRATWRSSTESSQQMAAFVEAHRAETRRYQEETRDLHSASAAQNIATQLKLDALIQAVTALPGGAQVLRDVFTPADPPNAAADGTAEAKEPGSAEPEAEPEPDAPPTEGGAPPAPEHFDGLDDAYEPPTQPPASPLSASELIATPSSRPLTDLMGMLRNGVTNRSRGHTHPSARRYLPGPDLNDQLRATPPTSLIDASARLRTPPSPLDRDAADASNRSGPAHWGKDAPLIAPGPDGTSRTATPLIDTASPGTPPDGTLHASMSSARSTRCFLLQSSPDAHTFSVFLTSRIDRNGRT